MELVGIVALILVCVVLIVKPILARFFPSASTKFKKYYPYAVVAFKYVEDNIPDDVGTNEEDTRIARYAHKVDLFCKKFIEYSERFTSEKPSEAMIEEAKHLATHLARGDKK